MLYFASKRKTICLHYEVLPIFACFVLLQTLFPLFEKLTTGPFSGSKRKTALQLSFVAGVGHDPTTSGLYPIGYNFPQFYKSYIRYDVI